MRCNRAGTVGGSGLWKGPMRCPGPAAPPDSWSSGPCRRPAPTRAAAAERAEGVEALAHPTPLPPGRAPCRPRRDVDHAGVAEHRLAPVRLLHVLRWTFDDDRELSLVLEDVGVGELRQHDSVARPD